MQRYSVVLQGGISLLKVTLSKILGYIDTVQIELTKINLYVMSGK